MCYDLGGQNINKEMLILVKYFEFFHKTINVRFWPTLDDSKAVASLEIIIKNVFFSLKYMTAHLIAIMFM